MFDIESMVRVRMADAAICKAPEKITTIGLGSCIGLVIYDPVSKVCGLLHAMLPDSTKIRNNSNRLKFVDSGIEDMLKQIIQAGGNQKRLVAKLAGGAAMFDFVEENDVTSIGHQNAETAKKMLKQLGIPLLAEDTGKNYGRTVIFDPASGELEIRIVGQQAFKI